MNRRGFLLGLIAAPAAPLAVKWTQPQPAGWFIRNEPPGLQRYWRGSKFRHATMYNPAFSAPYGGLVEAQAREFISQYRAMYPQFVKVWEDV